MKIGILQCDSILDQYRDQYENYPEMFKTLLSTAAPAVLFKTYDVEHGEYPVQIDECDAYVITGSKASVYDDEEWIRVFSDFLIRLHEHKKPLVGICFGHQLIAQALGGETKKSPKGWGVGVQSYEVVDHKAWQQPPLESVSIVASHQDQVMRLPPDAEPILRSEFCENAAFQIGEHILTFQGHPEFSKSYSETMMNHRRAKLGESVFEHGVDSLSKDTDSLRMAQWMMRFLQQKK
ncbi:MAG: gamma-glutamyl-gamma-aminobutyrate hydrolase family protein [Gammaproteobacteria bacterium]|nr:gamma-glutamyl-gamma-aminobutyrate hydrolase family protein [Gammaproteobacteria bacterium]